MSENIISPIPEVPVGPDYHPPVALEEVVSPLVVPITPSPIKFPFLLTISLFILSIIATLGIYILFQARTMRLDKLVPSSTPVPSPSPPIDSMADWTIFSSNLYGISFSYPPELSVRDLKIESQSVGGTNEEVETEPLFLYHKDIFSLSHEIDSEYVGKPIRVKMWNLSGTIFKDEYHAILEDYFIDYSKKPDENYDIKKIVLNGKPALRYKHCEMACAEIVLFAYKDQFISIELYVVGDIGIGEQSIVFDQILSTFKFLDCSSNKSLGLRVNLSSPWTCVANIDRNDVGGISLKSSDIDVEISDGGRGPYCGGGEDPENLCKVTELNLSDKYKLSVFNYKGEDKELFGTLGKTNRDTNLWISVKYKDIETKPLTESQKKSLLELLNSLKFD